MVIYVLRHGESIGNTKKGFISGRSDNDGLTAKGKLQIIRSAWDLFDKEIENIYTSPVGRAKDSAQIIGSLISLPVTITEWLTELDHGIFENNYWWNVMNKIPDGWDHTKLREDYIHEYPEGESFKHVLERVADGLEELSLINNKTVLIVTHNAIISSLLYFCVKNNEITKEINEKEFMNFIHNNHIGNAGYIKMEINENKVSSYAIYDRFVPLEPDEIKASWYIKGMDKTDSRISSNSVKTVSSNQDYMIITPIKSYFLKIMNDKFLGEISHYVKLYEYLSEKKIPAPRVLWHDPSKIFFRHETICYDYIEGKTLDECIKNNMGNMKRVLISVYELLSKIHSLPVHEVKSFWYAKAVDGSVPRNWKDFIGKALKKVNRILNKNEYEKAKIYKSVLDILEKYVKNKLEEVPIHGDLSTENIIVGINGNENCACKRIIDFELVRMGDPLWDFAYFYGWLERINEITATEWKEILREKLSIDDMERIEWYRILFHLWTISDMEENPGNEVMAWRGERSKKIILELKC